MLFNSPQYVLFLVAVFFAFWALSRLHLLRTAFLLAASYYFYANWNPGYLILIFISSTVDWLVGGALPGAKGLRQRRALLGTSIGVNLGILGTFKYFNFFSESLVWLANTTLELGLEPVHLGVLLPVGISFYTFQSMSYTIDVYRGQLEPERSYLRYLLFVSLFPQLVAGPIVRAAHFLPQLRQRPRLSAVQGSQALLLILIGLVKKVAIADVLAVNIVDRVFDFPERFSSLEVLAGIYGYAIQIYCDFSGYSDVAIGSAMLLGLHIPPNFDAPYQASNLREFWRRWHISLSTWLRDYLYIPLGGSRHGPSRTYAALMATMVLGGLWHGAAWTFVLWGLLHGLALATTRAVQKTGLWSVGRLGRTLGVVLTFHFVCFCWVLFRSQDLEQAWAVLRQVALGGWGTANLPLPVAAVLALGFLTHWTPRDFLVRLRQTFAGLPPLVQGALATVVAALLHHVAASDAAPFIYFQF